MKKRLLVARASVFATNKRARLFTDDIQCANSNKPAMASGKFKRLRNEITHYGLVYFIGLKVTELPYRAKTRKLEIACLDGSNSIEEINNRSVNKDSRKNQSSAFYEFKKGLAVTGMDYSAVCMLDIGCGFGKQLIFGMLNGFKKVAGIDLDKSAVDKANQNCRHVQTKGYGTPFNVQQADASEFNFPEGVNIIYMANPFGKKTMEAVMERIIRYRYDYSGQLYIVYSIPVQQDVLTEYKECRRIYQKSAGGSGRPLLTVFKIIQCNDPAVKTDRIQ